MVRFLIRSSRAATDLPETAGAEATSTAGILEVMFEECRKLSEEEMVGGKGWRFLN